MSKQKAEAQTPETALVSPEPTQGNALVPTEEYNSFLDAVSAAGPVQSPTDQRPKSLRLDGKAGLFISKEYNPDTKEYVENPFGEKPHDKFEGTILAVRYYAKWKYKEGSESMISTNEFVNWDEEVKVTKLNWKREKNDPSRIEHLSSHANYREFKEEYGTFDKATNSTSYPYDLYASLYVMVGDLVLNLQLKGSSRSNLFDYFREYKINQTDPFGNPVREMVQCVTEFGVSENTMPDGTSKYYSCTFKTLRTHTVDEMKDIMAAWKYVQDWFASLAPKVLKVDTEESLREVGLLADDGSKIPF